MGRYLCGCKTCGTRFEHDNKRHLTCPACELSEEAVRAIVRRLPSFVLGFLLSAGHDDAHRLHWSIRCMTCAPQNARERAAVKRDAEGDR